MTVGAVEGLDGGGRPRYGLPEVPLPGDVVAPEDRGSPVARDGHGDGLRDAGPD